MASRIKGLTIEIGGDTTGLEKSLSSVNKTLKTSQAELRDVNRLLKLDPKNVTLLEQKQKLLSGAIAGTNDKLKTLRTAADQAAKNLEIGKISKSQYDALQREIVATEHSLKALTDQAKQTDAQLDKFQVTMTNVGSGAATVADKTKGLTAGVVAIGTAALAAIPATDDFRDSMSKLEANVSEAKFAAEDAEEAFKQFYRVTGDAESSVEGLSNLLQTGLDESQIAGVVDALSGAVVRFPDTMKIESLADSLLETMATGSATGQFAELLDKLGISADTVSDDLAQMATEAGKQNYIMGLLAHTGLADSYTAWEEQNEVLCDSRDATLELQEQMADLAEAIMPLVTQVTALATAFLEWFNQLSGEGQTAIGILLLLTAAISPIATVVSTIVTVMTSASAIFTIANAKVALLVIAFLALSAALVAGKALWEDMSGMQRVVLVLGAVVVAATAAAIALGAFQSAATLGIAAVAITAGIIAITGAIHSATKTAKQSMGSMGSSSGGGFGGIPQLANGAVIAPNKPFLAMLGDQKAGTNIEAPLSTIKQAVAEVVPPGGNSGGVLYANMTLDGATLARVIAPYTANETTRRGVSLVKGG